MVTNKVTENSISLRQVNKHRHVPFHGLVETIALDRRRLEDLVLAVLDGGKTEGVRYLGDCHGTFYVLLVGKDAENGLPQLVFLYK